MQYMIILALIGFLITLHEIGHFTAAKLMKIPVARFSLGFGPVLWSRTYRGTEYVVCWIPLGGYVEPLIESEDDFYNIPWKKRMIFAAFGPLFNILGALVGLVALNLISFDSTLVHIFIKSSKQLFATFIVFINSFATIFSNHTELSGFIGIVIQGGNYVGLNYIKLINFSIMLNINLAVFNLLPVPPLDGGHILFYTLEKLDRRLLKLHIPFAVAGWIILIGLMIYSTGLDLLKYS